MIGRGSRWSEFDVEFLQLIRLRDPVDIGLRTGHDLEAPIARL